MTKVEILACWILLYVQNCPWRISSLIVLGVNLRETEMSCSSWYLCHFCATSTSSLKLYNIVVQCGQCSSANLSGWGDTSLEKNLVPTCRLTGRGTRWVSGFIRGSHNQQPLHSCRLYSSRNRESNLSTTDPEAWAIYAHTGDCITLDEARPHMELFVCIYKTISIF